MQTRLIDFACSDSLLTEEWERFVAVSGTSSLIREIVARLDVSPAPSNDDILEPLVTPLKTILGISAEEPGFSCVRIAPHPGELAWASGRIAIPDGMVTVRWERQIDRLILDVSIPVGVHLKAVLPAHEMDALFVNDESVDPDSQTIRTVHHVELAVLPGSDYRFEVVFSHQ